jgi:methionyl-tRNA synthetase
MARILITSALPYINGIKHLGNLAGSMLPADVYARFQRARGHDTLYICATDEHGTPAELAAAAAGQDVATYCAEQHVLQHDVGRAFGLSWDHFGRSSSPQNHRLTQHFCEVLEDRGLIEERVDQMVYSIDDKRFLPDRYIEGTCPHCGFDKARGDQCDNCGNLLDPTELKDPYSVISGSRNLEVRDTRHLYLLQTKMADRIRAWIDSHPDWQLLAKSIAYKHLDEGLIDRGITRDLSWGIPVTKGEFPRPGFEDKVFYVWFDAPIEYIAATQEWAEAGPDRDWKSWWRTDEGADDVRYVQFMGKDNVAFHTVSFPATILGSEEPWKSVDMLKAFNWLNWYGGKFSTSNRRGVFMDAALELLPPDLWRWYLTSNSPESSDTAFTWEQFASAVNRDLADVLGNFVNRILKFTEGKFDGVIPDGGAPGPLEEKLYADVSARLADLAEQMDAIEVRKSAQALRALWVVGNEYLQEAAPWTAIKTDRDRAAVIVRTALNLAALYARISAPFIPFAAEKIGEAFQLAWPPAWPSTTRPPNCRACRPAWRSARPRCCSRRSRTSRSPTGPRGSAGRNRVTRPAGAGRFSAQARLGLFYVVSYLGTGVSLPYIATYFRSRGLTGAEIGAVLAVPLLARPFLGPGLAVWADGFTLRRTPLALLALGAAAGYLAMLVRLGLLGAAGLLAGRHDLPDHPDPADRRDHPAALAAGRLQLRRAARRGLGGLHRRQPGHGRDPGGHRAQRHRRLDHRRGGRRGRGLDPGPAARPRPRGRRDPAGPGRALERPGRPAARPDLRAGRDHRRPDPGGARLLLRLLGPALAQAGDLGPYDRGALGRRRGRRGRLHVVRRTLAAQDRDLKSCWCWAAPRPCCAGPPTPSPRRCGCCSRCRPCTP